MCWTVIGWLLVAPLCSGCTPRWFRRAPAEPASPVVFPTPPTKEQVIGVINSNASRIHQLQSDISISVQGFPHLRGNMALERPRRFRLKAGLMGLPGTGVDLGSNDELFWIFFELNRPPGVYYARHDEFAYSKARQLVPIEPAWLIEALGVVQLDPGGVHAGPCQRVAGKIEIHSRLPAPTGEQTKITVVDERYGWVLEQYMYDANGQMIASARSSQHRYYPQEGVALPQHIEIQLAPGQQTQIALRVDVGVHRINQLHGDPAQLWTLPQPDGFPLIDITRPQAGPLAEMTPSFAPPPQTVESADRRSYRPNYRGVR